MSAEPERGLILRLTIWFTSTWLGQRIERLWKIACAMNPGFERYPPRTGGRLIPVIHCTPIGAQ